MKFKAYLTVIFLVLALTINAQTRWQENGIPVRQGVNIEWFRSGASMTDGSVVYTWSDTKLGGRDLYAQKVDSQGNLLWGNEPLMVDGKDDRQEDPVIIGTTDGGAIIAWVDFSLSPKYGDIFAQKLDADGNILWTDGGVEVCTAFNIQISLNIIQDLDGGAYVIWQDNRNTGGTDIYGAHLNSSGENLWTDDGLAVAAGEGEQNAHTFWEDGQGGAMLAYVNNYNGKDIHMKRISPEGIFSWGETLVVCDANGDQESVKICPDNTGGFIVSWKDKRSGNYDIYIQRVNIDGETLWTNNGISVFTDNEEQINPRLTESSDTGAFLVWEDGRNDPNFPDLYIQKININGTFDWTNGGIPVCTAEYKQRDPRLRGDNAGGVFIVWDDDRNGNFPIVDIYMQHIDSDGNNLLENDGAVVCNALGMQFSVLIKDTADHMFINWGDKRDGSVGLYYQVYDMNGNALLEDNGEMIFWGLSGNAVDMKMAESDNDSYFVWSDSRSGNFRLFYQAFNQNGSAYLNDNGIVVSELYDSNQQIFNITDYQTGGVVVAWEEGRDGIPLVFTLALDNQGNRIWEDPVQLSLEHSLSGSNIQVSRTDDSYYYGWSEFRFEDGFYLKIFANKVDADGNLMWGEDAVEIATNDIDCQMSDVQGRYFIWYTNNGSGTADIYIKLLDEDGNTAPGWDDDGLLICGHSELQVNPSGTLTEDGILVVWEDFRSGALSIYGQLINEAGEIQWTENGIPMADYNLGPQSVDQNQQSVIYDNQNFYMAWRDARTLNDDIAAQKFNLAGEMLWDPNAVWVTEKDSAQVFPAIDKINDRLLVVWEDHYAEEPDIFMQLLDETGINVWEDTDGTQLCNAKRKQLYPKVMSLNNDESIVAWTDGRSSGKEDIWGIYAQKVDSSGISSSGDNYVDNASFNLHGNYPNPFNPLTTIAFTLKNNAHVKLEVFNLKGQRVNEIADNQFEKGYQKVIWNGKDSAGKSVSSGIYFYKLTVDGESFSKKMMLMK